MAKIMDPIYTADNLYLKILGQYFGSFGGPGSVQFVNKESRLRATWFG